MYSQILDSNRWTLRRYITSEKLSLIFIININFRQKNQFDISLFLFNIFANLLKIHYFSFASPLHNDCELRCILYSYITSYLQFKTETWHPIGIEPRILQKLKISHYVILYRVIHILQYLRCLQKIGRRIVLLERSCAINKSVDAVSIWNILRSAVRKKDYQHKYFI